LPNAMLHQGMTMRIAPAQLQAEFGAYLDSTRMDVRMQARHLIFGALGLIGCLIILWLHFSQTTVPRPSFLVRDVLLMASLVNLTVSSLLIMWSQDVQLRHLRRTSGSVALRAQRVSAYLWQRDLLLLVIAVLGQVVAWFASRLGINLLTIDAPLVLLNLLPTGQQLYIGFIEIPTRKRLMFLYKLVALHELRAARTAQSSP
jgi:hypothetical protein